MWWCFQDADQIFIWLENGYFLKWKKKKRFQISIYKSWQKLELCSYFNEGQTMTFLPSAFSTLPSSSDTNYRKVQRRQSWTRHRSEPAGLQESPPYLSATGVQQQHKSKWTTAHWLTVCVKEQQSGTKLTCLDSDSWGSWSHKSKTKASVNYGRFISLLYALRHVSSANRK